MNHFDNLLHYLTINNIEQVLVNLLGGHEGLELIPAKLG